MRQKMKRLMGILLSLVMLLGLMPGMSLTALAYDGNPYASLVGTTTSVTFNDKPWYIIADNSTAVDTGTVTLLAANTSFGLSAFSDSSSNDYSNSKVKASLDALTTSGSFKDVADAIVNNTDAGGKMYLLSTSETQALLSAVLKMDFSSMFGRWWLRSPGNLGDADVVAFVDGEYGYVDGDGYNVREEFGVRPALKLNLSSVIFSSESKTFTLKTAGYDVTITPGSNMTKTADSGAASQTGLSDAMTPVVYTANDGYYFPTDYSVAAVNEISVTRDSFTQITVFGTPTANTEITLTAPTAKSKETTPTATFTATGADTGTLSGVAAGMKYSLDNGTTWTDISGSADINLTGLSAGAIQVVKKGNGTTTSDSDPQSITVTKAETPNLTVTQPTAIGGKGTVATTTAHEYSSDNGSNWTACTANQEFDAGTYLIRVKASGTVLASGNQSVTISEATGAYIIKSTQGTEHILGEDKDAVYTVTNSADDKRAFERFTGVSVDGKAVSEGNYTKASGSLVLTLKSAYLNTLSEGKHPMKISFSDGEVEISLTIKESTPTPTPKPMPKTGDQDYPGLWIGLMLIGIAGLTVLGTLKISRKRK